jgi:hypothetical protein
MNEDRLREMQQRMLRNYRNGGIGLILVSPLLFLFMPLGAGMYFGPLTLVLGILSVVRASTLASNMKSPGR